MFRGDLASSILKLPRGVCENRRETIGDLGKQVLSRIGFDQLCYLWHSLYL